jgi:hypothetical protein
MWTRPTPRALRPSDHPRSRSGFRSAAQRPALSGLIAEGGIGRYQYHRAEYPSALRPHPWKVASAAGVWRERAFADL